MEPLFLLDAYGSIYRSYFAFISKPLRNPQGQNVSAAFGFFRGIFQLWDQYKPQYFAAVFDSPGPTFRHGMYPEYKATRQKAPEDLHAQIPLVKEVLDLLGIPSIAADGYEADDLIATIAERCRREGRQCYVVSADKDLLQLVDGPVGAWRPPRDQGYRLIGPAEVQEEWGIPPALILDYLSLTGDSSDNIPGVPGVGDKTALKLLSGFGSFDAIWAGLETVKPDGLRKKLESGQESAILSRKLVTLAYDAPLPFDSLDSLRVQALGRDAASPVFMREGMRSLATIKTIDPATAKTGGQSGAADQGSETTNQETTAAPGELFPAGTGAPAEPELPAIPAGFSEAGSHEIVTDLDSLQRWVAAADKAGTFAFDCETDSLDEMNTMPVGFSLAYEPGSACYVPLASSSTVCVDAEAARKLLAPLLARKDATMVGQNLKFDMHIMENWGAPVSCKPWDTMVAAWLIDPERDSLKLEALGQTWLGYSGIPYADVAPKGTVFSQIPVEKAAPYAAEDAWMALRLKLVLEPVLAKRRLTWLFHDLEMPVLALLVRMEREGIMVDAASLQAYGKELETELASIQAETWALVGREFNMNSPKQLQEILFVERKLTTGKKTKTGYSTDISVLEELAREDPVPALILRHRTLQKLKSTYVDALVQLAETDPRIRTHFVQTGTATGRLSSRDPNLQNIPIREEEGRRIRSSFVAAPGRMLVSADYSQIELVVFAHLSGDPELRKAFIDGADVHRRTAALILGKEEAEVSTQERRAAKTINFGVIYGMGAFRLAQELGIPRAEAQKFIDAYFARYSGVAAFIRNTVEATKRDGYVSTILGRRRPVPLINSRNANERQAAERIAVNTPIQGSAADIMKMAMLKVAAVIKERFPEARLLLQVHDELILEAPEAIAPAVAAAVEEAMASAHTLSLPLRVGVELARNWGGMH
jgi:DNA polymerase-1